MKSNQCADAVSERWLLEQFKNGEMGAFTSIYQLYWNVLYSLAFRILKEEDLVKDVIHDVFADFWENRRRIAIEVSLQAYLITCVKNRCLKTLRKLNRMDLVEFQGGVGDVYEEDNHFSHELTDQIKNLLDKVPSKSKVIFELSREEDLSYKEIAMRMNLSIKSVEYHISKVLSKLRKAIYVAFIFVIFF